MSSKEDKDRSVPRSVHEDVKRERDGLIVEYDRLKKDYEKLGEKYRGLIEVNSQQLAKIRDLMLEARILREEVDGRNSEQYGKVKYPPRLERELSSGSRSFRSGATEPKDPTRGRNG